MLDNLYIVIPAYNEEEIISKVVNDWIKIVNKIGNGSKLLVIDDGSKDNTYSVLCNLSSIHPNLIVKTQVNSGHGQTIYNAYKEAISKRPKYIFQTDSDNQTNPEEFWDFWGDREKFDCIIGYRKKRKDGFSRLIVTRTLRLILLFIFNTYIKDANAPFRLMKTELLEKCMCIVPKGYNLTNVALSVAFKKSKAKILFSKVSFADRKTGLNSINIKKITKIGFKALKDFFKIRKRIKECIN